MAKQRRVMSVKGQNYIDDVHRSVYCQYKSNLVILPIKLYLYRYTTTLQRAWILLLVSCQLAPAASVGKPVHTTVYD